MLRWSGSRNAGHLARSFDRRRRSRVEEEIGEMMQTMLRVRLGEDNTHYPGGLIPAAYIFRLFADCSGEIGIRMDGVDGYLAAYESAEFLKPVYAGDYLEVTAALIHKGNRSRKLHIEARRVIRAKDLGGGLSGGEALEEPELVAKAVLTAVVPREYTGHVR